MPGLGAAPVNMYTTMAYKVHAVGVRAAEMPIPEPSPTWTNSGGRITVPTSARARRRMFRRLDFGAVPGLAPICCDTNDPEMVANAYKQRLLRQVPTADPEFLERFGKFVRRYLDVHVPKARQLSFEDWLESTSYNEARKNELRDAHDKLRGGRPTRRQASHVDSFVKTESYPEYKWARMINSRSDAFKVFSGPLFKAVEEVVYELPEFIKHIPVPDRPNRIQKLRLAGRRYFATDFTAFESHFVAAVMVQAECALYRHCLSWSKDVDFLCKTLLGENRMRTRTGVAASVKARRMSGDMCTSLGNGWTNLMLAKFLAAEQGKELHGYVEGDDGLFATEAELRPSDYARLGFTIKIEEIADPCKASFCGMVFAESGQIVRDPVAFCATFGWTSSFISAGPAIMAGLLRAKALSAVYETGQCPIVGALARAALERTRGVAPRWVNDGYHVRPRDEIPLEPFRPSADTRELVFELYGISVEVQLSIERHIAGGNLEFAHLLPAGKVRPYADYASRFLEVG